MTRPPMVMSRRWRELDGTEFLASAESTRRTPARPTLLQLHCHHFVDEGGRLMRPTASKFCDLIGGQASARRCRLDITVLLGTEMGQRRIVRAFGSSVRSRQI